MTLCVQHRLRRDDGVAVVGAAASIRSGLLSTSTGAEAVDASIFDARVTMKNQSINPCYKHVLEYKKNKENARRKMLVHAVVLLLAASGPHALPSARWHRANLPPARPASTSAKFITESAQLLQGCLTSNPPL